MVAGLNIDIDLTGDFTQTGNQIITGNVDITGDLTVSGTINFGSPITVANGGTGATTVAGARTALSVPGLGDSNTFTNTNNFTGGLQRNGTSAGHLQYINTFSASAAATLDIESTSVFGAGWDYLEFRIQRAVPVTDNVEFRMRVGTGSPTVTYQTTAYVWCQSRQIAGAAFDSASSGSGTYIPVIKDTAGTAGVGNAATESVWGIINMFNPDSIIRVSPFDLNCSWATATTTLGRANGWGAWGGGVNAITGVQFYFSSGNINLASIDVFGIEATA